MDITTRRPARYRRRRCMPHDPALFVRRWERRHTMMEPNIRHVVQDDIAGVRISRRAGVPMAVFRLRTRRWQMGLYNGPLG